MMVERIPWQYKWQGGEEIPSWLLFRRYSGLYLQTGDNSIAYVDNRIVISKGSYQMGVGLGNSAAYRWVNGFIAEFDVDASEFVGSAWTKGISLYFGNNKNSTPIRNITFRNDSSTRVSLDLAGNQPVNPNANVVVDLPSARFTVRFGADLATNLLMAQVGDKRRTAAISTFGKYADVFLGPKSYAEGSKFYIDGVRYYKY